jgi:PPK2 family polyphosphate:nucleotide phosphotransferase
MHGITKKFYWLDEFHVSDSKTISLRDYKTDFDHKDLTRADGEELLRIGIEKLSELQDKLYAHNQYSMLIIFQAMDAAGKDGVIKHVMTGLNPQGVNVTSFKVPTADELSHDFMWRHYRVLPERGSIGIFNRSHYENVLVTRVHPEYILKENLPGIKSVNDIDQTFWDERFNQINHFEKTLAENGTIILKFFLHISKKEQKKRFLERIDNPAKNWKFSVGDLKERGCWKEYRKAYEDMLSNTSKDYAPWFVVPADDKWFARLSVAAIIFTEMERMKLSYPTVSEDQMKVLLAARAELVKDDSNNNGVDSK